MRRVWIVAIVLVALAAASAYVFFRIQPEPQPGQLVYGSGRIEVDEVRLAAELPGRLLENRAREGEALSAGALVARLDPVDYELQAGQAAAERSAVLRTASQIDAQIALAAHHAETARGELARYETLRGQGWVTIQQLEDRRNAHMAAVNQVSVLREQRAQADARSLAAGQSLQLARSQLGRTRISAPLSGRVLQRLAEPGEVVAAGQPVAIIADLDRVRLRVFVSERDVGRLRLDAAARIRVDAFSDRDFEARVARVDSQAQFTPRDVHMAEERARTVYGVTLEALNPQGLLKPGMPADAWILWNPDAGWPSRLTVPG